MDTLILVQHCQSMHHVNQDARLWPDERNGLTETGVRQADRVAARMRDELAARQYRVYSSDMKRAAETAEIIGREIGETPILIPELREFNGHLAIDRKEAGRETGKDVTSPSVEPRTESDDWSLFDWRPFPGAETWREFYQRVSQFLDRLVTEVPDDVVPLLVVHGGTLSNVVTWWLRLPLDVLPERTPFAASPGSISVLRKNGHNNPIIERLNDTAHLIGIVES